MFDRMTSIGEELTRLWTTIHTNFVMSTIVRQFPSDHSFVKQLLEGQVRDRDEIFKRVKAIYNFLKSQSKDNALVARGIAVKKDPDKVSCFT